MKTEFPLVSVICLSFNHKPFVLEALQSVVDQTYPACELIIVDDASTDGSAEVIQTFSNQHPSVKFIQLKENIGNCKAFNIGLRAARGKFIIDFATDDIMEADRIARQVELFSHLAPEYGVVFTDATYIDSKGNFLRNHYEYLFTHRLLTTVPEGSVFAEVLSRYFIASPTMMVRREVFDSLGGYDEDLSYEDFDFWVRSSRLYKYAFLNERLTKIRRTGKSMSSGWYKKGDPQLYSTYIICKKAHKLVQTKQEQEALVWRLKFELRQAVFSENKKEARLFYDMLKEINAVKSTDQLLIFLNKLPLPFRVVRNLYHRIRY